MKMEKSMDEGKTLSYVAKKDGDSYKEAEVRSDFRDAIFWSPYSMTDADGYAVVSVKYPDNLTSWRITSGLLQKIQKSDK